MCMGVTRDVRTLDPDEDIRGHSGIGGDGERFDLAAHGHREALVVTALNRSWPTVTSWVPSSSKATTRVPVAGLNCLRLGGVALTSSQMS